MPDVMIDDMMTIYDQMRNIIILQLHCSRRREVAKAQMGHCLSARSDDDTELRRFHGFMLIADPDYVLALYPYPYP